MNKVLGPIRRAIDDYSMIEEGDRIAVGVSGGKDSTMLMVALNRLSLFYPKKFSIVGITLDMGMAGMDFTPIKNIAAQEGIEYIIKPTKIADIVFNVRKESNPCSLCALMRRGALHDTALQLGIKKIALGHHYDDVLETFMLNLIHEGRIGCFRPVTFLDRKEITVIRPLIYMEERDVRSCVKRNSIPVVQNPCKANGHTERQKMKDMLKGLETDYKGVKLRIFGALQRSGIDGWDLEN
ncbi:MAG: putative ATPase of the PP-loop superfamily implicated in cell cycle control [Clostridia bacterium]|nr:putative ATPase of the PP-loop superfamily implicated in cell cycle control [Clostridia bacterium]